MLRMAVRPVESLPPLLPFSLSLFTLSFTVDITLLSPWASKTMILPQAAQFQRTVLSERVEAVSNQGSLVLSVVLSILFFSMDCLISPSFPQAREQENVVQRRLYSEMAANAYWWELRNFVSVLFACAPSVRVSCWFANSTLCQILSFSHLPTAPSNPGQQGQELIQSL